MNSINEYEYSMNAERDVSVTLSHFNLEYVMSVIDDALNRRLMPYSLMLPNIIDAATQHLRISVNSGALSEEEVEEYNQAYILICEQTIEKLTSAHELAVNFDVHDNVDIYSVARMLYDFLVSNFKTHIVSFFSHYINTHQNELYESMGLAEYKKDKDSTVMFGRKSYDNEIITTINAHIEHVLYNMETIDISLLDILNTVYDANTAQFVNSMVSSDTFYNDVYTAALSNEIYGPSIITDIRLMLHNMQDPQRIDAYEQ